eukprot:3289765-Amphidinium_carterae.1
MASSKARMGKSCLSLCMATINANTWWKESLDNHLAELPGLRQWGQAIENMKETTAAITEVSEQCLVTLQKNIEDTSKAMVALRSSRTEALQELCVGKVSELSKQVLDEVSSGTKVKETMLSGLQNAVHELSLVLPSCAALHELHDKLGNALLEMAKRSSYLNLQSLLHDLLALKGVEQMQFADAMNKIVLAAKACKSMVGDAAVAEENKGKLQESWVWLLQLLIDFILPIESQCTSEQQMHALNLLAELPLKLNLKSQMHKMLVPLTESIADVQAKMKVLKPSMEMSLNDVIKADPEKQKVANLCRSLTQVWALKPEHAHEYYKEHPDIETIWSKAMSIAKAAEGFAKQVTGALEADAMQTWQTESAALEDMAGGKRGGKAWDEHVPKTCSWKAMADMWKKDELMSVDGPSLVAQLEKQSKVRPAKKTFSICAKCCDLKLESRLVFGDLVVRHLCGALWPQAFTALQAIYAITGKMIAKEVDEKNQKLVKVARVTKAAGCLLHALLNVKGDQCRLLVQAELKEVRQHIGKGMESSLLNPVLYNKASAVLKGASAEA